jgi:predicted  nucleic acid-binding Zn-ribbon protein
VSGNAVTKENISKALYSLSKTDGEILVLSLRKSEIQQGRDSVLGEIGKLKSDIQTAEERHAQLRSRQQAEEERLKTEEKKIVERRKQLTALGGTKGAKLVEREIDIAARSLQTMEQKAIQALEEVEELGRKIEVLKSELDSKQLSLENSEGENEKLLAGLNEQLASLEERRNGFIAVLDERLKNLYQRINNRYPGGAIAVAEGGACRSCYRSLPAQTFNQVLSGNLLQCPSCSRILITVIAEDV